MINKRLDNIERELELIKKIINDDKYFKQLERGLNFLNKQTKDLQDRINKAIEFVESMEYCGQEDYFYDKQSTDPCGNDNTFEESKTKLLNILQGSEDK